jgi:hypothetical protein
MHAPRSLLIPCGNHRRDPETALGHNATNSSGTINELHRRVFIWSHFFARTPSMFARRAYNRVRHYTISALRGAVIRRRCAVNVGWACCGIVCNSPPEQETPHAQQIAANAALKS